MVWDGRRVVYAVNGRIHLDEVVEGGWSERIVYGRRDEMLFISYDFCFTLNFL